MPEHKRRTSQWFGCIWRTNCFKQFDLFVRNGSRMFGSIDIVQCRAFFWQPAQTTRTQGLGYYFEHSVDFCGLDAQLLGTLISKESLDFFGTCVCVSTCVIEIRAWVWYSYLDCRCGCRSHVWVSMACVGVELHAWVLIACVCVDCMRGCWLHAWVSNCMCACQIVVCVCENHVWKYDLSVVVKNEIKLSCKN